MRRSMRPFAAVGIAALLSATTGVRSAGAVPPVLPRVSVTSVSVIESDAGSRALKFLVTLSQASPEQVTLNYATADGTAHGVAKPTTPGGDYQNKSGALTFKPRQVAKPVVVNLLPDTLVEGDETFTLTLSNVNGADVGDAPGIATIVDDDPSGGFRIAASDTTLREGDSGTRTMSALIGFSGPAPSAFSLTATTTDVTAHGVPKPTTPLGDYKSASKTFAVAAGARSATLTVQVLSDNLAEGDESFAIDLTSTLGTIVHEGTVTILDDPSDQFVNVGEIGPGSDTSFGQSVALDGAGNSVVAGATESAFTGAPEGFVGHVDVFVGKYSPGGTRLWAHQIGSTDLDLVGSIDLDGAGNVFVAGSTFGILAGGPGSAGAQDAYLAKYDSGGTLQWLHQYGTSVRDWNNSVTVAANGDLLVTGHSDGLMPGAPESTDGAYIARYDNDGNLLWIHQGVGTLTVGPSGELVVDGGSTLSRWDDDGSVLWSKPRPASFSNGIRFDGSGAMYFTGLTLQAGPGTYDDTFVMKLDADGDFVWSRQLELGVDNRELSFDVDASGHVIVAGYTICCPDLGFVTRLDTDGTIEWTRYQSATDDDAEPDAATRAVFYDADGDIVALGVTEGDMPGAPEKFTGAAVITEDSFVARYDSAGTLESLHVFGGKKHDLFGGLALSSDKSSMVLTGATQATLPYTAVPHTGGYTYQVFLARLVL
jgi:hypothetical protein